MESKEDVVVVLVGNKIDLEREVTAEEGQKLAENNGISYLESSALNNEGV